MRVLSVSVAVVLGWWLGTARGGVVLTVAATGTGGSSTTIAEAGPRTFSVDILVSVTDAHIFSTEANLVASVADAFEITSFSYHGPVWETVTTGSGGAIDPIIPKASNPPPVPHALPVTSALTSSSVAARTHGRHGSILAGIDQPGFIGLTGESRLVTLNLRAHASIAPGTYTLNVTRIASGEVGTFRNIGGTPGSSFTLIIEPEAPPADPPVIVQWRSVRTHSNGAGELSMVLSPTGVTTEPRRDGIQRIEIAFSEPVTAVDGTLDAGDVTVTNALLQPRSASAVNLTAAGNVVQIDFAPGVLADQDRYTIDVTGKFRSGETGLGVAGDADCSVRCLASDINGDGTVDLIDVGAIKAQNRQPVTAINACLDVNGDGNINLIDAALAKVMYGSTAP